MPRTERLLAPLGLALIAAFAVIAFAPGLDNALVHWDDDRNLLDNPHIRELSAENLRWMWSSSLLGVWQPLSWMITAAEYRLFDGADPIRFSRGLHVASLLLHVLAAGLVFFLARRLIEIAAPRRAREDPVGLGLGALFAALLFAVHPLRAETVVWASGQPYLLAAIPALACVGCYLRAWRTGRKAWHAAALAALAATLLCKAIAAPLVGVLLVLDYFPLRRYGGHAGWDRRTVVPILLEKLPYAALTAIVAAMTLWATWDSRIYESEPLVTKLLAMAFAMMFYVAVSVVPLGLAPYYMRPDPFDTGDPWFLGAALLFVAVSVAAWVLRRDRPWLLSVWVAYVVFLLPVTGLIKHGGQLAADRYSYLSCIGWALLVGAALFCDRRAGTARRAAWLVAGMAIVVALTWTSRSYSTVWKTSLSTWTRMVERNPQFQMGFYNLGLSYKRPCRGLLEQAAAAERDGGLETAGALRAEVRRNYRLAEANYRKAIELEPLYPKANVNLANMIRDGQAGGGPQAAIHHYVAALKGRPGFYIAQSNLGILLVEQGRHAEAVRELEQAIAGAREAGDERRLPTIRDALDRARGAAP